MPTVSPALQDKYDTYYPGQSEWRTLGAKDKAGHIVELCRRISPEAILDVGAAAASPAGQDGPLSRIAAW